MFRGWRSAAGVQHIATQSDMFLCGGVCAMNGLTFAQMMCKHKAGGEQERDEVLGILESLHSHVVNGADGSAPEYFAGYSAVEAK